MEKWSAIDGDRTERLKRGGEVPTGCCGRGG